MLFRSAGIHPKDAPDDRAFAGGFALLLGAALAGVRARTLPPAADPDRGFVRGELPPKCSGFVAPFPKVAAPLGTGRPPEYRVSYILVFRGLLGVRLKISKETNFIKRVFARVTI